jgi:formylglycine-generating enzyme required for sulfatase activity
VILTANDLRRIAKVAHARDLNFIELVGLAKLNPAKAFRGAILRGDLRNQNLAGFDFIAAEFRGCDLTGADLSQTVGVTAEMLATAITDDTTILPRALFWATGKPPSWAADWGRDSYGPWVAFRVPNTGVTQRMRWCPPCEFMMGSPDGEPGRYDNEGPRHRVVLEQGFWMFDTACSEALWSAVMHDPPRSPRGIHYPVTQVSWDEAQEFVQRLNAALPGLAIDLPSEAQWEYACRAGTDTAYSFGKRPSKKRVRYDSKSPVEVGTLPANPSGLFEMQGNTWEWCLDHWHDDYKGAPADGSAWLDQEDAANRVVRGGSWYDDARVVRAACRLRPAPTYRDDFIGFRCARVQAESGAAHAVAPADPASLFGAERRPQGAAGDTVARRVERAVADPKPDWAIAAGRDEFGHYATIQVPGTDVTQRLRWIPPGQFRIGSPPDEKGRYDEEGPQQDVAFAAGYWLFDTPVTQALWEAVMGNNPSQFKSPDRPVETVSFAEANAFIDKLNAKIPSLRLSLPSEAEWEYACRAGTAEATYAGNLQAGEGVIDPVLEKIAWYAGNSSEGFEPDDGYDLSRRLGKPAGTAKAGTRPLCLKAPNKWGLHDMLGNVSEWCADHWHDTYDGLPPDGSAWLDKKLATYRVVRGGSWSVVARYVRAAFRSPFDSALYSHFLGFRCARVQSDGEAERRAGRSKPRERSERAAKTGPRRGHGVK